MREERIGKVKNLQKKIRKHRRNKYQGFGVCAWVKCLGGSVFPFSVVQSQAGDPTPQAAELKLHTKNLDKNQTILLPQTKNTKKTPKQPQNEFHKKQEHRNQIKTNPNEPSKNDSKTPKTHFFKNPPRQLFILSRQRFLLHLLGSLSGLGAGGGCEHSAEELLLVALVAGLRKLVRSVGVICLMGFFSVFGTLALSVFFLGLSKLWLVLLWAIC